MNKNKLYKLILVLLVIIAAAVGLCANKYDSIKDLFHRNDVSMIYNTETVSDCFNTEFSSLYLECDVATVSVLKGVDFSITYRCDTNSIPKVEFIDGVCWIKQKIKNTTANSHCEIDIIIPENKLLDNLTLEPSVGSVYISNLKTDYIFVQSDVGSITVKNSSLGDSPSLAVNVGGIDLSDCSCKDLNTYASTGSISLDNCTAASIYSSTNIGSVSVTNSECGSYNLNTSLGDVSIDYHSYGRSYEK